MALNRFSHTVGFTLAELLIALALLGIIAAFTIPKVLQASAEQEKVAKLREAVATLENAWYSAKADNQLAPLPFNRPHDILSPRINSVRASTTFIDNPGELYASVPGHECNAWAGYLVLHNGVVIIGTYISAWSANELLVPQQVTNMLICIDINGPAAPNAKGQDVFYGTINPWGDFDWAGGTYTYGANNKVFHWGSESEDAYDNNGNTFSSWGPPWDDPKMRVGYWLTR